MTRLEERPAQGLGIGSGQEDPGGRFRFWLTPLRGMLFSGADKPNPFPTQDKSETAERW